MKRLHMLMLGLALLMVLSGLQLTYAGALERNGGTSANGNPSLVAAESVVPSAVTYVEGFNDDQAVQEGAFYVADWFGMEYTPTVSYALKRVELIAGDGSGEFIVQLRGDSSGYPSDSVLTQTSFELENTISWQGAEFSSAWPVTAGQTYWIVLAPVVPSQSSLALGGTPITHVWDDSGDGWDGKATNLYWMAKFYKAVEFQYSFQIAPFSNVIHLNVNPGGWLNGYMTLGPEGWNPVLGKHGGGRFYMAIDVFPDETPGHYELLFLVGTVATKTGQLIQTSDGLSYDGPHAVTLVPVTSQTEKLKGPDITEAHSSQVIMDAWYVFQINPYADIVHLNTNPGGWLNGYDDIIVQDAPVLGFAEGGRFYFAADGLFPPSPGQYTMIFIAGTVATRDGEMIRTVDGSTYDGPHYVWLT